jgi:hypothetical protein
MGTLSLHPIRVETALAIHTPSAKFTMQIPNEIRAMNKSIESEFVFSLRIKFGAFALMINKLINQRGPELFHKS